MDSLQFRLNNVRNSSGLKFSNHNHTQGKPNDQILQVLIEWYNHIFYSFDIHDILGCSRCHYAYLKQKVDGKDTVHVFIFSLFLNQKQESFHNFMQNISYNLPQDYELFFGKGENFNYLSFFRNVSLIIFEQLTELAVL